MPQMQVKKNDVYATANPVRRRAVDNLRRLSQLSDEVEVLGKISRDIAWIRISIHQVLEEVGA